MSTNLEDLPFPQDKKTYISEVLDPVLEEMVRDLFLAMPDSPVEFMIGWLRKRSGGSPSDLVPLAVRNQLLKLELKQMTGSLEECGTVIHEDKRNEAEEDEEEEEDDDDDCDELPESFRMKETSKDRARQSVSAEAFGEWNKTKAFDPPKYPKTPEQKQRLRDTLMKSFMFAELENQDMETVLMAMKEATFEPNQKVITEGENGDFLFVIETGSFECIKVIGGEEKVVKTCAVGDVFGELALLYNCPRAASVVAKEEAVCWQLDRESFNCIVKDAAMKRRNRYDTFLKSVALISSIDDYERSQIADALKPETYNKGDIIVRQDEPGDKFYIVEEGALYAMKTISGEGDQRVMDYKAGDVFGELALLKNQPRAASIIVESEGAKVLSMSRVSFNKMLGPLQALLARQVASYK